MPISRFEIKKKEKFSLAAFTPIYSQQDFKDRNIYGSWSLHFLSNGFLSACNTRYAQSPFVLDKLQLTFSLDQVHSAYDAIKGLLFSESSPIYQWEITAPNQAGQSASHYQSNPSAQLVLYLHPDNDGNFSWIRRMLIAGFVEELEKKLSARNISPLAPPSHHLSFDFSNSAFWQYTSYFQSQQANVHTLKKSFLFQKLFGFASAPIGEYTQFYYEGNKLFYISMFDGKGRFDPHGDGFVYYQHTGKEPYIRNDIQNKLHISVDVSEIDHAFNVIRDLLISDNSPVYRWRIIDTDHPLFSPHSNAYMHRVGQITLYLGAEQDGDSQTYVRALNALITQIEERLVLAQVKRASISSIFLEGQEFHHPLSDIAAAHWKYISYFKEAGEHFIADERLFASKEKLDKVHTFLRSQTLFQNLSSPPPDSSLSLLNKRIAHSFDLAWQPIYERIRELYGMASSSWPKHYPRLPDVDVDSHDKVLIARLQVDTDETLGLIKDIEKFALQVGIDLPDKNQLHVQKNGARWQYEASDGKVYSAYSIAELQLKVLASHIDPSLANLSKSLYRHAYIFSDDTIMYVHGFGDKSSNQIYYAGKSRQEQAYSQQHLSDNGSHSYSYVVNGKTVILQANVHSCTGAAIAMLIADSGGTFNQQLLFADRGSAMPQIYHNIEAVGMKALYKDKYFNLQELYEAIKRHGPAIVAVDKKGASHVVIVDAISFEKRIITIRDPYDGLMKDMILSAFERAWMVDEGSLQIYSKKNNASNSDTRFSNKLQKRMRHFYGNRLPNFILEGKILFRQAIQSAKSLGAGNNYVPIFSAVEQSTDGESHYRLPFINIANENDVKWVSTNDSVYVRLKKNNQQQAAYMQKHAAFQKIKSTIPTPTSPNALFSTPSTIAFLLKGWSNWAWQMPHDTNDAVDRAIQAHHFVNILQLLQGTVQTSAEAIKTASFLLKNPLSQVLSETSSLSIGIAKSIKLLKMAGWQALPYVNTLLDGLDFGFSSYEFGLAKGREQKFLFGTQLAISTSNMAVGGAALIGNLGNMVGLSRFASTAALPIAVFSFMISQYVTAVARAKNVQAKALALAQIFLSMKNAYHTPFTVSIQNNIHCLVPVADIALSEINFMTEEITFAEQRLYRAKQEQDSLESDAGYVDEFIDMPLAFNYSDSKKAFVLRDVRVMVLPYTPSHHFYYVYEIADYQTIVHAGLRVMEDISRQKEGLSPRFYKLKGDYSGKRLGVDAYCTQYVATDRKIIEKTSRIKIVLDQQRRDLYAPKLESPQDAEKIFYEIEGSGGKYFLYLEQFSQVSISNKTQTASIWTIDIRQLAWSHEVICADSQGLSVNGQYILRFDQTVRHLYLIDHKLTLLEIYAQEVQTDSSEQSSTQWCQRVLTIDWEQWRPRATSSNKTYGQDNAELIAYLTRLKVKGELAERVEIKNYPLYSNKPLATTTISTSVSISTSNPSTTSAYYDNTASSVTEGFLALLYREMVELHMENGYQSILQVVNMIFQGMYGQRTTAEKEALLELAQQVDKKLPQYQQLGHPQYLASYFYVDSLKECSYNEKHAKHYQYLQIWLSRLEDKVRELKEIESWISDAELIGTQSEDIYFYSRKHAVIWSGHVVDSRNNKSSYTNFYYLLANGMSHSIQRVVPYLDFFLIDCQYTFSNTLKANIWYRLQEKKIYLDSIHCTDSVWISLISMPTILEAFLKQTASEDTTFANRSGSLRLIEKEEAGEVSRFLYWDSKAEEQVSASVLNKTQFNFPQVEIQFVAILTEQRMLRGWFNRESQTFVQPYLKDDNGQVLTVLPSDLAIGSYTKIGTTEVYYFYSVRENKIWAQIGAGVTISPVATLSTASGLSTSSGSSNIVDVLNSTSVSKAVTVVNGIKRVMSYHDSMIIEDGFGLIYIVDVTADLQLSGITPLWLDRQTIPWWQAISLLAQQHHVISLDLIGRRANSPYFWYRHARLIIASPSLQKSFDLLHPFYIQIKNKNLLTGGKERVYFFNTHTGAIYTQTVLDEDELAILLADEQQLTQALNAQRFSTETFKSVDILGETPYLITNEGIILLLDDLGKLHLYGVDESWQASHSEQLSAFQQLLIMARDKNWELQSTLVLQGKGVWYHTQQQRLINVPIAMIAGEKIDDFEWMALGIADTQNYFYSSKRNMTYEVNLNTLIALTGIYFSSDKDLVIAIGSEVADNFGVVSSADNPINRCLPSTLLEIKDVLLSGGEGGDFYRIDRTFQQLYPYIEINNFDPSSEAEIDILCLSVAEMSHVFFYKENEHLYITEIAENHSQATYEVKLSHVYSTESAAAYRHLSVSVEDRQTAIAYTYTLDILIEAMSRIPTLENAFDHSMVAYQDLIKSPVLIAA